MVEEIFLRISLLVVIAVGVSAIMKLLRQPLLIGYIITGIIVGPYFFDLLKADDTIGTFSKLGVALLLFTVGLHLNPRVIKKVGKISLITGVGQVIFTSVIGFVIARFILGLSSIVSLYIAIALTFSSTIIIMKLLSDKGDLETTYGRISIGFLIVQDLIVVLILMFISALSVGDNAFSVVALTLLKGVGLIIVLLAFSFLFLPKLTRIIARSQEFLFLFSLAWALIIASLFQYFSLSLEIGALLAGIALSVSPYSSEISAKLKPLRDFFILMFFIIIGSQMVIQDVQTNIVPIIIFSLFILIGNPFIVMVIMGFMGYTKRNGFLAGLTVAQISEFSIIMIALGISVGHLTSEVLSLVTFVGLITIAGSTYMITFSDKLYSLFSSYLNVFQKKKLAEKKEKEIKYSAILFGYNRIGFNILRALEGIKQKYVVVDFNPDTIENLEKNKIPCIYGDAFDEEFLQELNLKNIKIAISTIPEFETNEMLIRKIKSINPDAIVIVRSHQVEEAMDLYKMGANYVLTPHFLGGEYVAKMIRSMKVSRKGYHEERHKHKKMLTEILKKGHEHPKVEKN